MVNCGACGKFLSPAGAVTCSTCPTKYHRACVAVPEKAQIAKDWVCPNCKRSIRRGDNSQTPVKGIVDMETDTLNSPPPAEGTMLEFRREFSECLAEMREFRKEMANLREAFTTIADRMSGIEGRLDALEQARTDAGTEKIIVLERTITELKLELNERDQEALLADIEIGHLPEEKGVSVAQSVCVMAARLGVSMESRDVVFAERVGAPPAEAGGRPRRVVVRLARRDLREDLLRAARVRRNVVLDGGARVFLNERLTRSNRHLFHRVREVCGRLQWRYAWTRRGRILVRQADSKPVFQLRSEADFPRVFGESIIQ